MNLKVISRNVGLALLVSALFMFLSIIVSLVNGNDSALAALSISFCITFIVGIFPFIFVRKSSAISLKDGYMIIFLSWLLSFIFGALPYALWGGPFTLVNAWFESVSGFTTTGATVLSDVESLPHSLLFWRSSTNFIGGLGIVVFLLLIIPGSSQMKLRLTNMELSSLSREGYQSRANKTVSMFTLVYLGLIAASFLSYVIAGMTPFEAINHAFSVCATGGFSTRNNSIAGFNSIPIDIITIVFMYLSSIHFGLIYLSFARRSLKPLNNPVVKYYSSVLVVCSVLVALSLKINSNEQTWGGAFLDGTFQVVSYASATGFATADNSNWPLLANFILILMSVECGCAGSTTGGLKCDRVLVLFKAIGRHIRKIIHPSSVTEIKMGSSYIHDEEIYPFVLYFAIYLLVMSLSVFVCLLVGATDNNAITGTLSCLGNVGPGVGAIGSMGNYNGMQVVSKVMFTLDMFLGRVEIYPILVAVPMFFSLKNRGRS